jgi:transposase InsO family protein
LETTELEHGELKAELSRLAAHRHDVPGRGKVKFSVATLRRWLTKLRKGGLEDLKPRQRDDYGKSRAIPEEWVKKAMSLRAEVPSRSARVLVEILERLPGYPGINVHTLDNILRRNDMPRRLRVKPLGKRKKRWSAKHVNHIWQGDATPGIWLPDPRDPSGKRLQTSLYLWIDDVSRLVPFAQFFFDEKLPRMERTLKLALLRRGVPKVCYTDNGHVYRATQFIAALAELGIHPVKSRVYYPQGRGKIERLFGVIQTDLYPELYKAIEAGSIRFLSELNEALWAWLDRVYHQRVHSETKMTPLQAYHEGLAHVRSADPVKVARAFLWRYTRVVSKNGFISLLGNTYSVDPSWAGRKLELRLDPFDLSDITIYRDARPVAKAKVREMKNSTIAGLDIELLKLPTPVEPSGVSFLDVLRREYRQQQAAEMGEISFVDALHPTQSQTQKGQP